MLVVDVYFSHIQSLPCILTTTRDTIHIVHIQKIFTLYIQNTSHAKSVSGRRKQSALK